MTQLEKAQILEWWFKNDGIFGSKTAWRKAFCEMLDGMVDDDPFGGIMDEVENNIHLCGENHLRLAHHMDGSVCLCGCDEGCNCKRYSKSCKHEWIFQNGEFGFSPGEIIKTCTKCGESQIK